MRYFVVQKMVNTTNIRANNVFSVVGIVLIVGSVVLFDNDSLSASKCSILLIPIVGSCLIVLFSNSTIVCKILSNKHIVYIGLISYSLYLWHQPVFVFIRAYFKEEPPSWYFIVSLPIVLLLAHISWKYIETPFRNKNKFSRKEIFWLAGIVSVLFCVIGLYLNSSYGLFHRCYGENISISDMDKRIYNSKVFQFKKDSFGEKNDKFRLLVLGNSFGRDFVNIILETYDTKKLDIVYRDDFDDYSVLSSPIGARLFEDANLVVFASSKGNNAKNIIRNNDDKVFYLGTKFFGYNENWIIRLPSSARKNQKKRYWQIQITGSR